MTREEAKKIIFSQWQSFLEHNIDYGGISEAYKMAIKALEQEPYKDNIRKLINEFDKKHSANFANYMIMFNNHTISEIMEYMRDMNDLIDDIMYQLPTEGEE